MQFSHHHQGHVSLIKTHDHSVTSFSPTLSLLYDESPETLTSFSALVEAGYRF